MIALALKQMPWPDRTKHQWLLAFWCFDSAGLACWLTEYVKYSFMLKRVATKQAKCPVGSVWPSRYEFNAPAAIEDLLDTYGDQPEDMVQVIRNAAPDFYDMISWTVKHPAFAPPLGLLVLDMTDVVFDLHTKFPSNYAGTPSNVTPEQLRAWLKPWARVSPHAQQLYDMFDCSRGVVQPG